MKIVSFIFAALISRVPFAVSQNIRGDPSRALFPFERDRRIAGACLANPSCAALNLKGQCCPTTSGQYLDCCKPSSKCAANAGCAALGLTGECCPSNNGQYLDCCAPRECNKVPACNALGLTGMCCPSSNGLMLECCSRSTGRASDIQGEMDNEDNMDAYGSSKDPSYGVRL